MIKTSMPPRQSDIPNAREAILDAAEVVFSQSGYDGASMRMISTTAGVAQALLHYHFQSKERLFEAIFERRSTSGSGHRGQLLNDLFEADPNPSLEAVLRVLLIPLRESTELSTNLAEYFQLVAAIGVGSDERSKSLIKRYFDPIAHRFISAFLKVVPGLSAEKAVWSYLFAIGSRMQAQASNGRADRLSRELNLQKLEPLELLVSFAAAGIRAIVAHDGATNSAVEPSSASASASEI